MTARRRWVVVGAAAVLGGVLALLAAVHSSPVRSRVRQSLVTALRASGVEAHIDDVAYNALLLRVRLEGVELAPLARPDAPFFEAEAIVVDLPWSWMLGGRLYVQDIELRRPRLLVRTDAEGTNLPSAPGADEAQTDGAATQMPPVERLLVEEATIEWGDEPADASLRLADLSLSWSGDGRSIPSGRLEARAPGVVRWGRRSTAIDDLTAALSFDGAALHIEGLSTRLSFGSLSGDARVAFAEDAARVEADLSGDFDVAALAALIDNPAAPSSGRLTATARIEGRLVDPSARVQIAGRSIAWSSYFDPIDADLTGLLDIRGATVESMRLSSAGAAVEASGFVPFTADAGGRMEAEWSGLDAAAVVAAIAAASAGPPIAATLEGNLTATWTGSAFDDPTLRGHTRSTPGVATANGAALGGEVSIEIDPGTWSAIINGSVDDVFAVDGRAGGTLLEADLLESTLTGDVSVTIGAVDVAAKRLAELGIVDIASAGTEQRGAVAAFPLSGSVGSKWDLSGSLGDPRGSGEISGKAMRLASVSLGDVDAAVELDRSGLVVRSLHGSPAGGTADAEMRLDFSTGTLDGDVHVDVPEIAALLPQVPEAWRPRAPLRLQASIAGTANNPAADFELESGPMSFAGQVLRRATAAGSWSEGLLHVERFELLQADDDTGAPGVLRGSASYRPGTAVHELRFTGERWHLQALPPGSVLAEGVPVDARLGVQWESSGALADPEARATFSVSALAYGDISSGALNAEVDLRDGLLAIGADSDLLASHAETTLALDPWGDFTFSMTTERLDLLRVRDHLGLATTDVAGNVSFVVEGSGNIVEPLATHATLELRELDAVIDGTPLHLVDAGLIELDAGELRADPIDVRLGGTYLRIRGRSGVASELQVDLSGDLGDVVGVIGVVSALAGAPGVDANDAPAADLGIEARGAVELGLRVSGSIDAPDVSGFVDVTDAEVALPDFPGARDVRLALRLRNGALEIEQLSVRWQGATLSATGLVPLASLNEVSPAIAKLSSPDDTRLARLAARVDSVTPAMLAPFVDEATIAQLGGTLSARLEIETEDLSLAAAHGDIVIEELALRVAGAELGQRGPTRVRLAAGALHVEQWTWVGPAGEVTVEGSVELEPQPVLALTVLGDVDLRVLRAAFPDLVTAGHAQLSLDVAGPAREPGFDGSITVVDGELRVASPRFALTEVVGTVNLDPQRIVIERLSGLANGGTFSLTGEIAATGSAAGSGALHATADNVALEPLRGLGTLVDADLSLDIGEPMTLRGDVTVLRGEYRERLSATSGLLAAIQQQQGQPGGAAVAGSALDDLRLDIRIDSSEGLLVDNNLAQLTADLDLVLSGTVARPALGGRIELREGGTVFLSGNRFRLEEGAIDFVDPESVQPDLDLNARARISIYDVDLAVSGTPDTLDVALSSTPELDQSDLVSLVVTGHTLDEAGSMPTQVARDQVLGLITAEVSGRAGRAIGLDSVRIERGGLEEDYRFDPSVVAPETDPGARLSLYKSLSDNLDLVYSQSLKDSGKFTWIIGYRFLRNFSVRWLLDDDNSRAYELSQDLGFGAPATAGAASRAERIEARPERVRDIRLKGTLRLGEASVRDRLRLRPGDRFDYFRWQDDRDRLERFYQENGYLEARVTTRRTSVEQTGDSELLELSYDIEPGPQTILRFEGRELSGRARRDMEEAWTHSVFDGFLVDELEAVARRDLADDGYVSARVDVRIDTSAAEGTKTAVVSISPGERPGDRRVEFRGNARIGDDELSRVVDAAGLGSRGWTDRAALEAEISALYRRRGMLDATVRVDDPEGVGSTLVLPVFIDEGAAYDVAYVALTGVVARDPEGVLNELGLSPGDPFAYDAVDDARRAVEASYRGAGFAHVSVQTSVLLHAEAATADVTFAVDEGPRQVLADIVVTGAVRTRRGVIDRSLRLTVGEPLDPAEVYNSRQRLYQSGVFRRVDMVIEPIEQAAPPATAAGATPMLDAPGTEPVRLLVRLQERAPFRFRYGVRVNDTAAPATDSGRDLALGFSSDLSDRNVLGHAATTSVSLRYQADFRAVRGFLGARSLFGLPVASNVYVTRSHEEFGQQDVLPFVADRSILTLEQRLRPSNIVSLAYSYNFERNHTFDPEADPDDPFAFDISVDIAVLRFSALFDTRDDLLDARRGWSHSSNIDYSVPSLGSDLRYVKYLMQQTYFHPLPGDVVLASAARLGLATSFEDELIPSERFFAGGGNSVRGYPEDSLGPQDFFGAPVGGEALLLLKQELRFPVWRWFRGVGFFDAGNAFESVRDISLADLATSWGLGLRVDTPFALLRLDYGFRLGRSPGDPRGRFFFSIGQSF